MAGGRSPVNENNALPIFSVAQWVAGVAAQPPTVVSQAGTTVTKYWNAAATGINNSVKVSCGNAGRVVIVGNALDFRGCSVFTLMLRITFGDAAAEAGPLGGQLMAEGKLDGDNFAAVSADPVWNDESTRMGIADFGSSWNLLGAGFPYSRTKIRGYSNITPNSGSATGTVGAALVGAGNVRMLLFFPSGGGGANQTYSLEVWGSNV